MTLKEQFENDVDTRVSASRIRQQLDYMGCEDGLFYFRNKQGQGLVLMARAVTDFADPASGVVRVITTFHDERVDLFEAGAIADAKRDVERYEEDRSSDQAFTLA